MKVGIGLSTQKEALSAGKEAWHQARIKIGKEKINLAILFSSVDLATSSLLKALGNNLEGIPLIGCSTAAIISNFGIHPHAVALILISCEGLDSSAAYVKDIKAKSAFEAGVELANKLLQGFTGSRRDLSMIFCDGLMEEGSKLILGIQERLGRSFPIIGASASDNRRFYKTYLYYNSEIFTDACVGLLWGGKLNFSLGIKHGWKPLGKHRIVTEVHGNIIETIDNKRASSIYEEYFAKDIAQLKKELKYISTLYPIGLYLEGEEEYLLRNILSIKDGGALVCQGDIPVGSQIRLMIGTQESCLLATQQAAQEAKMSMISSGLGLEYKDRIPDIIFVFDSISRYILLRRNAIQELNIIKEAVGENTPIIGLYTYGEQAPLKAVSYHGQSHFHNQTITIVGLGG